MLKDRTLASDLRKLLVYCSDTSVDGSPVLKCYLGPLLSPLMDTLTGHVQEHRE